MHYKFDTVTREETVIVPTVPVNTDLGRDELPDTDDANPVISDVSGDYESRVSPRLLQYLLDSVKALQRG